MVFNFRNTAHGAAYEILLLLVSGDRRDAPRLADALAGGDHSVSVEWIPANEEAPGAVRRLALQQFLHLPAIIAIDYRSYGNGFRALLNSIRQALGERYAEFIAINVPNEMAVVSTLKRQGVTVLRERLPEARLSMRNRTAYLS